MKYLKDYKYFKLFEGNTISTIEVEDLTNDILLDLKDINSDFSWKIEFEKPESGNRDFIQGKLCIFFSDVSQDHPRAFDDNKIRGYVDVLDRLFKILISEDLKIYDTMDLIFSSTMLEVEPGKINQSWKLSRTEDGLKWKKEFIINSY
jgi:hypothetical protein